MRPAARQQPAATPAHGTEAAARMASLRQALRAADMMAGKSSEELAAPVEITEVWPALPLSTQRCFASRSDRVAKAAGVGLAVFDRGPINPAAAERLRQELREGLAHIQALLDRR
jgi:hypothetical protein